MGYCPEGLTLIGCQLVELEDYGGGLRPLVAERIAPAIETALAELGHWGVRVTSGSNHCEGRPDPSLARAAYEDGRPSEADACRSGDPRYFPDREQA